MKVISFNEIIEFNKLLEKQGYKYKLHLRDTCGCQSFWVEDLNSISSDLDIKYVKEGNIKIEDNENDIQKSRSNSNINKEKFCKLLEDFFLEKKLTIIYNNDSEKIEFVVK